MKLSIFICIMLFPYMIQSASYSKDVIIHISDYEWDLSSRTLAPDGSIIEKYHRKDGPKKLPLEFHFCLCMISIPCCCCCSHKIKHFLNEYKNQHIDLDDHKRKIYKEYYPYAQPPE